MRKILFIGMFCLGLHAFAGENEVKNVADEISQYELNVNYDRLANVLKLKGEKRESLKDFINYYELDVENSIISNSEEAKKTLLKNNYEKHVKYMHYILSKKQYRKYIMLLNLTLENRGIELK